METEELRTEAPADGIQSEEAGDTAAPTTEQTAGVDVTEQPIDGETADTGSATGEEAQTEAPQTEIPDTVEDMPSGVPEQ